MRTIILKQHSPMVILRNSRKDEREEIPKIEHVKEGDKHLGWGWIIAGAIVLIAIIIGVIHLIRKDLNADLVNAQKT